MKVLVDTSIWSAALRRRSGDNVETQKALLHLIASHAAVMIGPIRQEILSGIKDERQYAELKERLSAFPDLQVVTDDYTTAARFFNMCRSKGIQGSNTDFLICAVAVNHRLSVFTSDADFAHFQKVLPIELYRPRQ